MPKVAFRSRSFAAAIGVLFFSVIACIITIIVVYKSTTTGPQPVLRLPRNLIPHNYKLFIQLHLYTRIFPVINSSTSLNQTMLFTGNSTVSFHCVHKTNIIVLHSKALKVFEPEVRDEDTNGTIGIRALRLSEDENCFLEIQLDDVLEAGGNYSLFLAFRGPIQEDVDGLFFSTYVENQPADKENATTVRFLAATHMEPLEARTIFPCFDEPEMKAVFDVTIIHRRDTIAHANGQKSDSNIINDDWKYTSFHPSPKMSTYLFAITVSEFTSIPSLHERVEINTFARPEATAAGHTQYAANITGKILTFYEAFFEINYPHNKLDQFALPESSAIAMENWGLVTYQEAFLFFEEGVSTPLEKEMAAEIIAHELAHQWFGNLVTMKWWNELWLKEGFATYMSYIAVDHVEPTFTMRDRSVMGDLESAFEMEALVSGSHPLSAPPQDVKTTAEITGMFDTITYCKGAFVLKMLADIVDERVFNKGVKMYLSEFRSRTTDQNDLWEYIQKAVDADGGHTKVATVMDTWTKQIGYPLITINTTNGEIYQKRFLLNSSAESSTWWHVPIRVISATSGTSFVILETNGTVKKDEFVAKSGEWILANVNRTGYYRVNYNSENWACLLTQLETDPHRIPVINRGQLIDDAFHLAKTELVTMTLALNTTRFLWNESAYIPWKYAVNNLEIYVNIFSRSEVYGPMQAYLQQQIKGLFNSFRNYTDISEVPEDHSLQCTLILAIEVACSNGLPECLAMATRMFGNWMNNNTKIIHPPLWSVICCQAVAAGGRKEWEFVWNRFKSSNQELEKKQLRDAMACTRKVWLLNRYLEYTLDSEKIDQTDIGPIINNIGRNVAGEALAWNFIRAHWEYLSMGDDADQMIEGITSRFSTQFELDELARFAADHSLGSATRTVEEAIARTKVNMQLVSKNKESILRWFEGQTAS